MRIIHAWPPNIDAIRQKFGPLPDGVMFAWAPDLIFVPGGRRVSTPLRVHEAVHHRQQGDDPRAWWESYLQHDDFRLRMEVEAHQVEWKAAQREITDRNGRAEYLHRMAARLASSMYGKIVTFAEAKSLIKGGGK